MMLSWSTIHARTSGVRWDSSSTETRIWRSRFPAGARSGVELHGALGVLDD